MTRSPSKTDKKFEQIRGIINPLFKISDHPSNIKVKIKVFNVTVDKVSSMALLF